MKVLVSALVTHIETERSGALAAGLESGREHSSNALRGSGSDSAGSIIRGMTVSFGSSGRLGIATCTG